MPATSRIQPPLTRILLILLLCSGALSLAAQQDEPPEPAEKTAVTAAQENGDILPLPPAKTDADNIPATTPSPEDADSSPFDYQSSEKISEDLSVSFPVDI